LHALHGAVLIVIELTIGPLSDKANLENKSPLQSPLLKDQKASAECPYKNHSLGRSV